jgi:Patatin-like phospholipase
LSHASHDPDIVSALSVPDLAAAARPGAPMDESSRKLLERELETLQCRRDQCIPESSPVDLAERDSNGRVLRTDLTGIALSGGGIRSATFCLGVLQALAKANLLKRFDYLSTVSGGGYVGSSLTWWLSGRWRPSDPEQDCLPEQSTQAYGSGLEEAPAASPLAKGRWNFGVAAYNFPYGVDAAINVASAGQPQNPKDAGPRLLNYLRKHGKYLTPGGGISFWSGVSVGIRAIFLNLFVWIPLVTAGFLFLYWLPRGLFPYASYVKKIYSPSYGSFIERNEQLCSIAPSWGACLRMILGRDLQSVWQPLVQSYERGTEASAVVFWDALMIAGVFAIFAFIYYNSTNGRRARKGGQVDDGGARSWWWPTAIAGISALILLFFPPELPQEFEKIWLLIVAGILVGTYGILCLIYSFGTYVVNKWLVHLERWDSVDHKSGDGTRSGFDSLVRTGQRLASSASAKANAAARAAPEFGYMMRRLFESWAGVYLSVILGFAIVGSVPPVADWLQAPSETGAQPVPAASSGAGMGSGFFALLAGLVATITAFLTTGARVAKFLGSYGLQISGFMAMLAAALLLFGVLVVSYQASVAILTGVIGPLVALLVLAVAVASGFFVNTNYISLGRFYRDRLLEAFMPGYDTAIAIPERTEAAPKAAERMRLSEASKAAPYHIVNTNVVLIGAEDRRRKIRGGDSFILTRDYCGSNATGWRATDEFMAGKMTVSSAMAISGAAANPNTGVGGVGLTRSRAVSVLMALVNLRLGYWAPHPTKQPNQNVIPNHFRPGLTALIKGHNEDYPFQELTDGGHFENLGLYELVRRRLRLILVCDAGADPGFQFGDLQVALRRIEEDFGARVEFCDNYKIADLIPQKVEAATYPKGQEMAELGFAVAKIRYASDLDAHGKAHPDARPAWLVYLKSTIVRDLPLDLRGYKGRNPDFPDQSTGDQFFDEDQFEAYRDLGQRLAAAMIEKLGLENVGPNEDLFERIAGAVQVEETEPAPEHGVPGSTVPKEVHERA